MIPRRLHLHGPGRAGTSLVRILASRANGELPQEGEEPVEAPVVAPLERHHEEVPTARIATLDAEVIAENAKGQYDANCDEELLHVNSLTSGRDRYGSSTVSR